MGEKVPGQIAIVGRSMASRPAAGTLNRNSGRNGTGGTGTLAGGTAQGKCTPPFANGRGLFGWVCRLASTSLASRPLRLLFGEWGLGSLDIMST